MSSAVVQRLVRYLSATETRSGEAIGNELGCSRSAVWKHVETLRQLGIEVSAVAGKGYRLSEPLELLEKDSILNGMSPAVCDQLTALYIETSLDSTNSAVQRLPTDSQHAAVILAEHQSTGRGRRGRQWHSPFGKNLYLSLGWKFDKALSELGCLPLVVALAAAQALERAGLKGHRVKWPNDLLLDGQKLCGCLVEVQGDAQGPCHAVLGVGVNVQMPHSGAEAEIDQPWTDVYSQLPGCSRNTLATLLMEEMISQLSLFAEHGFTPFRERWAQLDGLHGQTIEMFVGSNVVSGTARGIDERGALILDTGAELLKMHSGEVTMHRPKGSV